MAATRFGRPPVIRVEQFEDVATAIRSTDLAGPLPEVLGAGDPALEPIPGTPSVESDLWLFYHASRRGDRPLHDVADWIVRSVRRISCEAASAAADDPGPIAVGG
jgi:DNA-binding transcriptional LysR family regulator